MKKILTFLFAVLFYYSSFAQSNQIVWLNGRFMYSTPIERIDSITFGEDLEADTLLLLMPRTSIQIIHDTIYINGDCSDNPNVDNDGNEENTEGGEEITETPNYFYIASLEDNNQIDLTNPNTWAGVNCTKLEFSYDKKTWTRLKGSDILTINKNDSLFMRCRSGHICKTKNDNKSLFYSTGKFNIGGNLHTLIFDYTTVVDSLPIDYCMKSLFNSKMVVDASQLILPAKILSNYCYASMFADCKELKIAPKLPATQLAEGCYSGMFSQCEKLEIAPDLLADTMVESCYSFMFQYCTKLKYIKCLAKNISGQTYTSRWTEGVATYSNGKFVQSADASGWVVNYNKDGYNYYYGIPYGWIIEVEYDD
jgi:hypothetical protein